MPKIIESANSELFEQIMKTAKAVNGEPDSLVVAVACAADVSYTRAREAVAAATRPNQREEERAREALRALGMRMTRITPESVIARYPLGYQRAKHVTTHHPDRFPVGFERLPNLLMFAGGRAVCVKDGECHDWSRNRSIRVSSIFRVTKVQ